MRLAYELRELRFAYAGGPPVLEIDYLAIAAGGTTALIGANGTGKSTLLNVLAFLLVVEAADFRFFGEQVRPDRLPGLRKRVACVQQKPYLFNYSVRQNIALGLKLRGVARDVAARSVDAALARLGIEHLQGRSARQLSGGEVQKVALARALVLEPEVLILDEPFSHLDTDSASHLESTLADLSARRELSIVFSSHDQVQAQGLADEVLTMTAGAIQAYVPMNSLRGRVDAKTGCFATGRVRIRVPTQVTRGSVLIVSAADLVLSRERLDSSMRNQFRGVVKQLREESGEIHVLVEAEETWHAVISPAALAELGIGIGEPVWVNFKANAVRVSD